MNTTIRIALGAASAATAAALAFVLYKKRKSNPSLHFMAPDGNTYKEGQIYKTIDNQYYKNGKPLKMNVPPQSEAGNVSQKTFGHDAEAHTYASQPIQNVNYHHRGQRHH